MAKPIIVIGAGISGITTALTLQLLGYDTVIYAEHLVEKDSQKDPRFASLYPAASVIPHSVQTKYSASLFPQSLQIFKTLFDGRFPGMIKHRHYEIYEFPVKPPAYTTSLDNFAFIEELAPSELPRRPQAKKLHGWAFDCFVAEWPEYMHGLYKLYENAGGSIQKRFISQCEIEKLPSNVIINCSGIWSSELFEDTAEPKITRGHTVQIPGKSKIRDSQGRICSYNYTPLPSVYDTPDGEPCDVYFYPIADKWVLGGSRQAGKLNNDGNWVGRENDKVTNINDVEIPSQIIDLNTEILRNTYQINLKKIDKFKAFVGYRFQRVDRQNGLRLETSEEFGKTVIHNYGHGGAGVTLSWGCALKIFNLINDETDYNPIPNKIEIDDFVLNTLQLQLQRVY